jgi:hypothetical protein
VIVGNKPPAPSDKTIKYITSANWEETVYSGPIAVAWDWIEFCLYDGETRLDQKRVFALAEGEPAREFRLKPSETSVTVNGGVAYPYKISCFQFSITGSGLPIPSNKILKYKTSLEEEQLYTGEIIVNPLWKFIDFYLYDEGPDGELVPLDNETVGIFTSGEDRFFLDLIDQHITVRADEYGEPYSLPITTQAALYRGNTPITYTDFVAKTAEKSLVLYPGSGGDIFTPMLGGFYPTRSVMWNISAGAIDQNGFITIRELKEDKEEIEVFAFYDDVEYTATLTLIKVKDGEAPAVIDIENESASISCDSYGTPLSGELPFSTKAVFYKGTQKVTPFWFLSPPAGGASIAQDGTIAVAANAALGRTNNFLVNAAYRGKTYSRMFTLAKALEGFAATRYELLPGDSRGIFFEVRISWRKNFVRSQVA